MDGSAGNPADLGTGAHLITAVRLPEFRQTLTESITPSESVRLVELERIIDVGKQTFVEVGNALAEKVAVMKRDAIIEAYRAINIAVANVESTFD